MQKDSAALPLIAAYVGYSIWGLGNLFIKIAQNYAAPNQLLSHRFLISAIVMLIPVLTGHIKFSLKGKPVWPIFALAAVQYLYYLVESYAIKQTNATITGASAAVAPVISVIIAAIFLKEYPTRRQALFCLLPIVGVVLMTVAGKSLGVVSALGVLFLALTILTSGFYKVLNRKSAQNYTSYERTLVMLIVSAVSFTIGGFAEVGWDVKAYVAPLANLGYLGSILTLALVCSIGCNLLANYAMGKLPVVKSSSFGAILTLVSMLAGVVFLKEPISWTLGIGAALILFGIYQVTKK
jgi:drug/metabolite transporter (DMT)-like permease